MLSKKKSKLGLDSFFESIIDRINKLLDQLTPRDLIYIISYFAAVDIIYTVITGKIGVVMRLGRYWSEAQKQQLAEMLKQAEEKEEPVDGQALMKSLVIAYMVLKIDIEDVASGISKLSSASIGKLI